VDRHSRAGQILQVLGVMLMAEHVCGLTALQRGADAVGADLILGVAEAGGEQHTVEVAFQIAVCGQPVEHDARGVGQDDADRLAVEMLVQVAHDRHRGAGERCLEVGVTRIGQ
jgi:hypothetical protein